MDLDLKSNDTKKRLSAVLHISNEKVLINVAKTDDNHVVRKAAVKKIHNQSFLKDIAKTDDNHVVRRVAIKNISDQHFLLDIVNNDADASIRRTAFNNIDDEGFLVDILNNHFDTSFKLCSVEKINNQNILIDIVKKKYPVPILRAAVAKIEDEDILIDLVNNHENIEVAIAAVAKIEDEDILVNIIMNHQNIPVKVAAVKKIGDDYMIFEIIKEDLYGDDKEKRLIAVEEFLNLPRDEIVKELPDIIKKSNHDDVFVEILEKWDTFDNRDFEIRCDLVNAIKDKDTLIELTYNHLNIEDDIFVASVVYGLIKDGSVLVDMAKNMENSYWMGSPDIDIIDEFGIVDEDSIIDIAKNAKDWGVRFDAVDKIMDEKILKEISKFDESESVRKKALEQIENIKK